MELWIHLKSSELTMDVCTARVTRRRFLRQSFAFSAAAAFGSLHGAASMLPSGPAAADLLMIGDWGYDDDHTAQSGVAVGMRNMRANMDSRPRPWS
jgi:tartrate-resistant acid phosphatase type 5